MPTRVLERPAKPGEVARELDYPRTGLTNVIDGLTAKNRLRALAADIS